MPGGPSFALSLWPASKCRGMQVMQGLCRGACRGSYAGPCRGSCRGPQNAPAANQDRKLLPCPIAGISLRPRVFRHTTAAPFQHIAEPDRLPFHAVAEFCFCKHDHGKHLAVTCRSSRLPAFGSWLNGPSGYHFIWSGCSMWVPKICAPSLKICAPLA